MDILTNFGVQPTLLFGQIVNFLIILFLLRKFFFGKISKALEDRKQKIEESLRNADLIEERLAQTEVKSKKILEDAQDSAQKLISQAKEESLKITENASNEAKKIIETTTLAAQNEIAAQREKMKEELMQETMVLVTLVTQKVLGRNLKPQEKQNLTKQALSEITKKTI